MSNVSRSNINGHAQLRAPPQLTETERKVFAEVVTSVRTGHFEPGDMALLVEFSRLTILVGELWEEYRAADAAERRDAQAALTAAQKALFACCRMLRLAPSARAPHVPSREAQRRSAAHARIAATGSLYDQMEISDGPP